ncbi:hypothetical protein F5Y17DRAFT_475319 [Xylariaceae sp. FL0594]|nr:hypothetical protein F5Y17DRAFT_475319 [Xylariaceae sp. FL0594]
MDDNVSVKSAVGFDDDVPVKPAVYFDYDVPVKPAVGFRIPGVLPYDRAPPPPPETTSNRACAGIKIIEPVPALFLDDLVPIPGPHVSFIKCIQERKSVIEMLQYYANWLLSRLDEILGDRDAPIATWADDIAGCFVKQALVTAAKDTSPYGRVFRATATVVLCGTPHRGSSTRSFHSTVHSIIKTSFPGILDDSFPETLETLCQHIEKINQGFRRICHNFSIINYYERPSASDAASFRVLLPYECATLGVPTEINIGVNRPHDRLRMLDEAEVKAARSYLLDGIIKHRNGFRYFFDLLQLASSGHSNGGVRSHSIWNPSASLVDAFANDSGLSAWLSGHRQGGALRFSVSCPTVGRIIDDDNHSGNTKASIYASLLAQVLTQQPQVFLQIEHLMPQFSDAMRSSMPSWRERCLWMCLRTLLCSPGVGAKYLFLRVACNEDQILQDIDSFLKKTDALVRLVFVVAPGITLDNEDGDVAHLHGPDDLLKSPDNLSGSIPKISFSERQPSHAALERVLLVFQELEWAITWDQAQQGELQDLGTGGLATSDLVAGLQVVFPGLLKIRSDNRVVLCISYHKVCNILLEPLNSSLREKWSPHLYLADTYLGILKDAETMAWRELETGFTVYAAHSWIHHNAMAAMSANKLALGKMLEDESLINF